MTAQHVNAAQPIVTRFAPSPTGHLHVGGARTAMLCWAFAQNMKRQGLDGRFMIRIEDTDQARSSDESAKGILDDLAWLGITWDDGPTLTTPAGATIGGDSRNVGPYFQARRIDIYNAYIEHLVRCGRAYPAFETSDQLNADRKAAESKKQTYKYPRPSDVQLGVFNEQRWTRAKNGEPHVIRFVMPPTGITVTDLVLGEVKFAAGEVDDFVIRKQDGFPTYHFAVVIDDELMGVTHVMRAQEHLINTPKHVALQGALTRLKNDRDATSGSNGQPFRVPQYAHMPLIFNIDGTKMSKRDKAKAARKALKDLLTKDKTLAADAIASDLKLDAKLLADFIAAENDSLDIAQAVAAKFNVPLPEIEVWDYRKSGYLPHAITNFLSLLGWSPGLKDEQGKDIEKFDLSFLSQHFSIDRLGKTAAKFDRVKLLSFNADAIVALADHAFDRELTNWANQWEPTFAQRLKHIDGQRRQSLMRACKPRCKTLRDAVKVMDFALTRDDQVTFDPAAVAKANLAAGATGHTAVSKFRAMLSELPASSAFEPASIDAWIKSYADANQLKMGDVAQPIRVALTGTTVSPPLGDVVSVLGIAGALTRLDRCLATCTSLAPASA